MIDKVIPVMQKIIDNPERIQEIVEDGSELYFKINDHCFSIVERREEDDLGRYSLFVYPQWEKPLQSLANVFKSSPPPEVAMMAYHQRDFPSQSDLRVFSRLYQIVQAKFLKIDQVFDDILEDDDPPGF